MYYTIVGDIEFTKDEEWKDEASILKVYATMVTLSREEALDKGEWLAEILGGKDWLVPQVFEGRIYNKSDKPVLLTDAFVTAPESKVEWAKYRDLFVAQHLT